MAQISKTFSDELEIKKEARAAKKSFTVQFPDFQRFRIKYSRCYWKDLKARKNSGSVVFADIWKKHPNSICFTKNNFDVVNGASIFKKQGAGDFKYSLNFKNGRLNVFKTFRNGNNARSIRNISSRFDILDNLKITKLSEILRLSRSINYFLRSVGDKRRISLKILREAAKKQKLSDNSADYPSPISSFNQQLTAIIYPNSSLFNILLETVGISYTVPIKKHNNLKKIIRDYFGYNGKKLTKLVCEKIKVTKSLDILMLGRLLKGLIPVDYFYKFLDYKAEDFQEPYRTLWNNWNKICGCKYIREFIKEVPEKNRNKFLDMEGLVLYMADSAKMLEAIRKDKPNYALPSGNLKEIHDELAIEQREITNPQKEIKYSKEFEEIDGEVVGDMTIELPRDTHKLITYSELLHSCISGYGDRAAAGYIQLLAIYRNNKLLYNIEIRHRAIVQFKANQVKRFDSDPNPEDREKIVDFLLKKDIVGQ